MFGRTIFAVSALCALTFVGFPSLTAVLGQEGNNSAQEKEKSAQEKEKSSKSTQSEPVNPAPELHPHDQPLPREQVAKAWAETGWPLLQQFCVDCHNADFQEAEMDLSRFDTLAGIEADGEAMNKVMNMIRFGAMPPEDYDLPTDPERKQLGDLIDEAIYAVTCDTRPRPGRVTARRLNRAEYNHSIRDLFGVELNPAEDFPSDEVGGGFDNNADVLSLSPMLIDKYLSAAESISKEILLDPSTLPDVNVDRPADQFIVQGDTKTGSFYGRFLSPEAYAWTEFEVPYPGEYRFEFRGGATPEDADPAKFAMYDQEGLLRAIFSVKYYGGGGGGDRVSTDLTFAEGMHRVVFVPLGEGEDADLVVGESKFTRADEFTDELLADGRKRFGEPLTPDSGIDTEKYPSLVRSISVTGPKDLDDQLLPPSHKKIVHSKPKSSRGSHVREAAVECLQPLMRRAFRGPVTEEEVQPYAELVAAATARDETFERGLQIAISAVLVSPRFLFRIETPPADKQGNDTGEVELTQHQLASRLSFFLWSSLPDETLLDVADRGDLQGEEVVQQIRRMLDDPRAETLATEFAAQWLGLRNLDGHQPDAVSFEGFEASLLPLMAEETRRFFLDAVRENRPVSELLTSDQSFLNEPLARYYGVDGVKGNEFQRVSLKQTPRRGLLGHASVLTLTSEPTRTSPVKRGKWILENIMGTPPPEPPSGVPELGETKTASANATLREQLELHREDPSCAACHRVMDQLGFGLENFDAVGRFREHEDREGKVKIDPSGVLPGGRVFAGAAELSHVLGESEKESFARTVAQRLLGFALGRELTLRDRCAIDEIVANTKQQDFRIVDMMIQVARCRPFLYYEWTPIVQK